MDIDEPQVDTQNHDPNSASEILPSAQDAVNKVPSIGDTTVNMDDLNEEDDEDEDDEDAVDNESELSDGDVLNVIFTCS